jgi:NDP-sugar pyrophosphorylase family protein
MTIQEPVIGGEGPGLVHLLAGAHITDSSISSRGQGYPLCNTLVEIGSNSYVDASAVDGNVSLSEAKISGSYVQQGCTQVLRVTGSTIKQSTLVAPLTITGANVRIENSILSGSWEPEFPEAALVTGNTNIKDSTVKGSRVTIHNSDLSAGSDVGPEVKIENSELIYGRVENSEVKDSTLQDALVLRSKVKNSDLFQTYLFDSKMEDSESSRSSLTSSCNITDDSLVADSNLVGTALINSTSSVSNILHSTLNNSTVVNSFVFSSAFNNKSIAGKYCEVSHCLPEDDDGELP